MRNLIIASLLTLSMTGCVDNTKPNDAHVAYYSCLTATGAAGYLAAYNNKKPLPLKMQNAILPYVDKIDAVCSSPTPVTNTQLQAAAFQEAAAFLVVEATKLGAK